MKDSITIITINDPENYGNRLQNFALIQLLKLYGSSTTAFSSTYKPLPALLARLYHPSASFIKRLFHGIRTQSFFQLQKHHRECVKFTHNFAPTSSVNIDIVWGVTPRRNISERYVLGSDQIWNTIDRDSANRIRCFCLFLGSVLPEDASIISYAASFGLNQITNKRLEECFQRYLPRLKAISVREYRGAELVKEMTGLDAPVVLDPTLMLDTNQWNNITRGFVSDSDKYVLTYFLGKPSDEQEQAIQDYAKAHGCRVRRILDLRDKETYVAGPQDFVELFSKAQYVFTDSYHACCFSILYHKQFTVFNRAGMEGKANMNSRMETLFRLFDLDSVVMDKGLAPRIDYDKVDKLLAQHREESQAWLDRAMEA